MKKEPTMITLNDIHPIIRYAQLLTVPDRDLFGTKTAYDNRLFLCIGGRGEIVISDIAYKMEKGTVLMWRAGMAYRYEPSPDAPLELIGFNFDFTTASQHKSVPIPPADTSVFDYRAMTENVLFSDITLFNAPLCIHDAMYLKNKLFKLKDEFVYKKNYYIQSCSGLLLDILASCARAAELLPSASSKNDITNDIIAYIHENYSKELSNESIANTFGYHSGYVGRLIKRATGMSTHQYLLNYRIERAIDYLQSGNANVSEVCYLCGFHDLAHFSKCFKLKTGYSPSHYTVTK